MRVKEKLEKYHRGIYTEMIVEAENRSDPEGMYFGEISAR